MGRGSLSRTGKSASAAMLAAVALILACLAPCMGRTAAAHRVGPGATDVDKRWTDIERKSAAVAKDLSPAARQAMQASLSRFYQWVAAYCGVSLSPRGMSADEARCVDNEYVNFLADVPRSVYRVGRWPVYETTAYGLEWPDGDLLDQDAARPMTWLLRMKWPQIDSGDSPLSRKMRGDMKLKIQSIVSGWAVGGWEMYVSARIETVNSCYVSVGIEQSAYSGGAHSNVHFESFNWNRAADAPLNLADLFQPGGDWRHALVTRYEAHVRAGADRIPPSIFEDQPFLSETTLEPSIDKDTVVTDHGLKLVISGLAPAFGMMLPGVELTWAELQPWLVPSAPCTYADPPPAQP